MATNNLTLDAMSVHEAWRIELLAKLSTTNWQGSVQALLGIIDRRYPVWTGVTVDQAFEQICKEWLITK